MLCLLPKQFEALQPGEFYKLIEGYEAREKANDFKRAYFVAWLIAPHLKEPVSAQDILKPLYDKPKTQAEQAEDKATLMREFGLDDKQREGK